LEINANDLAMDKSMSAREQKRIQRIDDIIETAASIFVRDGFAQFSARRVASELGISLSNLQHYCGTTENLLLSMISIKIEGYVVRFRELAQAENLAPKERFLAILDEDLAATNDSWIASFSFQVWALADHDQAVRDKIKEIYGEFCQLLTGIIREVNPRLSIEKADACSTLIASQIEGLLFYNNQVRSPGNNWETICEMAKIQWLNTILSADS